MRDETLEFKSNTARWKWKKLSFMNLPVQIVNITTLKVCQNQNAFVIKKKTLTWLLFEYLIPVVKFARKREMKLVNTESAILNVTQVLALHVMNQRQDHVIVQRRIKKLRVNYIHLKTLILAKRYVVNHLIALITSVKKYVTQGSASLAKSKKQ